MTALTLVLPFALPPPEIAPDLTRLLKAPALAALLSRSSTYRRVADEDSLRHLPHERWLAERLGAGAEPQWTGHVMRGHGCPAPEGHWFTVHPGHIEIARSHLLLTDVGQLGLADTDALALFDAARPYFTELGLDLSFGSASTWFLRADAWAGMHTASPAAAAGMDISFFLPTGPGASAFRKLQNEIQMLWFEHPVNVARAGRRQRPVNAIWPWAGAAAADPAPRARLYAAHAPTWLDDLARASGGGPATPATLADDGALICIDAMSAPAIASDWPAWVAALDAVERDWAAPLLAALRSGAIARLTLVLSGRAELREITTSGLAQRKFWRRPTLESLLP